MPGVTLLNFPVWTEDSLDFLPEVSYEVHARQVDGNLEIQHMLNGKSLIQQGIQDGTAKFSVLLLYRETAERYHKLCDSAVSEENNGVVATQYISMEGRSYAPEIAPSIVVLEDYELTPNAALGLHDFWKNQKISIPKYSRIAIHPKLTFVSGDVSHLFRLANDKELKNGEMKVEINEHAGENQTPVTLFCGQDVFDALHKIKNIPPVGSAIITHALSQVYAYMNHKYLLSKDSAEYATCSVLKMHLDRLKNKTHEGWEDDNFNPSLAATKMHPYVIEAHGADGEYE